ncbi:response regulator transcription factor [Meiothermus granaticius]|uniref:Response regulator MprA n=1 Tax=Meiothermus granaticius NBRC 107808 TaxID=1227551 RepID=A0A399F6Q9_9DEIN|nr:response regulator transcription factor [Meiothermus granaticius]RIH91783.1 Response regulator MprA [Meiothermus granaticius NBRC 107808]GEM87887.1 DNA-binding response regulator [Meiothermus granaticius NBRC 107808]
MPKVLLVEDDPGVREALKLGLELEGYVVVEAENGAEGLRKLGDNPDLIVLDVLLPGGDGFGVLREIRRVSPVPVLMLTALDEVEWRVKGLREGADDYLVKPYALAELVARLEALLRRNRREEEVLSYADVVLYPRRMEVRRRGELLELSPKATLLLQCFLEHPERLLPKETLMGRVWGEEVEPNTLEVHLSTLRRALGEPNLLHTLRGHGYILRK